MASGPLPKPKRGVKPRDFYLDYVPRLWASLSGGLPLRVEDHALTILVGGEAFTLRLSAGQLSVREGEDAAPLLRIASDAASFRTAAFDLLPRLLTWLERRVRDIPAALAQLAELAAPRELADAPGALEVRYVDDAGDPAEVRVSVAGGGPRCARVELTDAELWRLLECEGRPSQLLRSRVRLDGDVAYLIELARALET